jgi:NAD(P)-dependent dehydrogenase (short-subunit alcohol dehydrogenase family)
MGKRVLITGCSSGFGMLAAVGAAKAGYDVVATMRNLDKRGILENALARAGVKATIDALDITDEEAIKTIVTKYAPIDILVNNAGILIMGSFLDITTDEARRIFETNYFGTVTLTRMAAEQMIRSGGGTIINVASLAGRMGHPFNAAYSASKHALIGFSRSIRLELKPYNIKVVSVEPGYHKTEIVRANANQAENFYNRDSVMFDYNRGFLQLMFKEIIPRAGAAEAVAEKIVEIMGDNNPRRHYIIGKDAKFAAICQWLGLTGWLENKISAKLMTATDRQRRREERKKASRKTKAAGL